MSCSELAKEADLYQDLPPLGCCVCQDRQLLPFVPFGIAFRICRFSRFTLMFNVALDHVPVPANS